jgi:hypothetical protein
MPGEKVQVEANRSYYHAFELFKRKHPPLPSDVDLGGDSGYQGIQKGFPEIKSMIPVKKPKGEVLPEQRKDITKA